MNDTLTVEVQKRERCGTNVNRRLRASGKVPAVVYGGGRESVAIEVDRKTVLDLLKESGSENPIFLLKLAGSGGKERHAMIRDMQVHPIDHQVLHIDFQRIDMAEKVRVQVPIVLTGTAYGVKNESGILDFVTREVHIECLPGDIPRQIELDVTPLTVGQHVEAGALQLPAGVTLLEEPDRVIASVSHARVEEGAAAGGEGLIEAQKAEPEVVRRGKTEAES